MEPKTELSEVNAAQYLAARGVALQSDEEAPRIRELGGGVSNTVLLVESAAGRFVLKQALGRLRVKQEWLSDRARILRESGALRRLAPLMPAGSLPEVLFEDRENFIYAMSAAPAASACWKDMLLAGEICEKTAARVGELLASMAGSTWRRPEWEAEFGDQTVFDQLRIDPYYRAAARRHPDLAPYAARLIEESAARRVSLTHGDWSPKNFLVNGAQVIAIDFEVIHFGDPTFDAAFMLNHLMLKSFYRPQWRERYHSAARSFWRALIAGISQESWIERATIQHLGWLMLARVDGKSPAEYLGDGELADRVRRFAREWIVSPPAALQEVIGKW